MSSAGSEFRKRMTGQTDCLVSMKEYVDAGMPENALEDLKQTFRVLCDFLEANMLANGPLYNKEVGIENSFMLSQSQLNAKGKKLFPHAFHDWLRGQDNGKPICDTSRLQKALSSIEHSD